jgi:hypothetical protein
MGPFVAVAVVGLGLMFSQRSVTSPFGFAGAIAMALGADSTLTITSIIISRFMVGRLAWASPVRIRYTFMALTVVATEQLPPHPPYSQPVKTGGVGRFDGGELQD